MLRPFRYFRATANGRISDSDAGNGRLVQEQTQSQLRGMHLSARLLEANAATAALPKLQKNKGKEIELDSSVFDEPLAFATSLAAVLRQAGRMEGFEGRSDMPKLPGRDHHRRK